MFGGRQPELAAIGGVGAGLAGLMAGTAGVVWLWPTTLPPEAPLHVAAGAAMGATAAGLSTAAVSALYVQQAYAGSDCFCGGDLVFVFSAPIVAPGAGAMGGAAATVTSS